jgi:GT2 family glycosyltransferase
MLNQPLVSVITSNYNCGIYLQECISSVLSQTYPEWEHLIAECGSTDSSREVLERNQHERMRVCAFPRIHKTEARNNLIAQARGKYIAILDADDGCLPRRFECQVAALESDASLVGIGSWVRRWYTLENRLEDVRFPTTPDELDALYAAGVSIIPHSTLMVRKDVVTNMGGYDTRMKEVEDFEFTKRLLRYGKLGAVREFLATYCMRTVERAKGVELPDDRLLRAYVAHVILAESADACEGFQPPFRIDDPNLSLLERRATALVRKACFKGIFSGNARVGTHCRALLAYRSAQTLFKTNIV